jgi:cytochrome c oxidase subunit 2
MQTTFPLFPESASTMSGEVDALYFFLVIVSAIMTVLIFLTVAVFAIRYRRRWPDEVPRPVEGSLLVETTWSVVPFLIMLVMFGWGAKVYFDNFVPPEGAMEVYVVGKQWMWKLQHPEGQREINELHIPTGRPVKLTLTTEDVIHSFFIPAFRVKHDVVPGQYTNLWFQPTKPGNYHLFCAEYCGNQHSGMIGWIHVMEPAEYEKWLSGAGGMGSMASIGERMFQQLGCSSCHWSNQQGRCPNLSGVYGSSVLLKDGRTVTANDSYIRESIIEPTAKVVAGFEPIMPTYQGQISEEGLLQLIAYIKSLSKANQGAYVQ